MYSKTALYGFDIDEDSVAFPKEDAELVHNITAKLLCVCPRGLLDL